MSKKQLLSGLIFLTLPTLKLPIQLLSELGLAKRLLYQNS